jgi:hypothetical protein
MRTVRVTANAGRARVECRLPMTTKAGDTLARHQKLIVYRAVDSVAGGATVTSRIMLKHERSPHFLVTVKALFVVAQQHSTPGGSNIIAMHIMAIRTEHVAFQNRVMMLEHELALDVKMATEACPDICDQDVPGLASPVFNVNASRPVTCLAPLRLPRFCLFVTDVDGHTGMLVEAEVPVFGLVTI